MTSNDAKSWVRGGGGDGFGNLWVFDPRSLRPGERPRADTSDRREAGRRAVGGIPGNGSAEGVEPDRPAGGAGRGEGRPGGRLGRAALRDQGGGNRRRRPRTGKSRSPSKGSARRGRSARRRSSSGRSTWSRETRSRTGCGSSTTGRGRRVRTRRGRRSAGCRSSPRPSRCWNGRRRPSGARSRRFLMRSRPSPPPIAEAPRPSATPPTPPSEATGAGTGLGSRISSTARPAPARRSRNWRRWRGLVDDHPLFNPLARAGPARWLGSRPRAVARSSKRPDARTDPAKRLAGLQQADDRLAATVTRVDELQKLFDALARRDEDRRKLLALAAREENLAARAEQGRRRSRPARQDPPRPGAGGAGTSTTSRRSRPN